MSQLSRFNAEKRGKTGGSRDRRVVNTLNKKDKKNPQRPGVLC